MSLSNKDDDERMRTQRRENGLVQLSRSAENVRRIKSIQDKFVNSQNLQKDGRALIGEGILMKVCRKKPKQRAFFLFNDILVYGRVVITGRRYSQQKILQLHEVRVTPLEDSLENLFAWVVSSPRKSFVVRANSDRERQEWLTHLQRCIQFASNGSNNRLNALAAPWVPDGQTDVCMHCRESKFSAYNRRHHCRHCGFIVCDGCSKRRFLLAHLDSKPVRVCDACFVKLNSTSTDQNRFQMEASVRIDIISSRLCNKRRRSTVTSLYYSPRPAVSPLQSKNQRDRTADSSDSDEENGCVGTPTPTTFYEN